MRRPECRRERVGQTTQPPRDETTKDGGMTTSTDDGDTTLVDAASEPQDARIDGRRDIRQRSSRRSSDGWRSCRSWRSASLEALAEWSDTAVY